MFTSAKALGAGVPIGAMMCKVRPPRLPCSLAPSIDVYCCCFFRGEAILIGMCR